MDVEQIILLVINIVGGIAVVGGYWLGLRGKSGASDALWGGVPKRMRPLYVVSMLLSAAGYLAFFYFILFKLVPDEVTIRGGVGFELFYPVFVLILIPSAFWMPLTKRYVDEPGTGRWIAVRVVLFIVGLASIVLAWALFALEPNDGSAAYWAATVGATYFAFHTFVLDALLWAALFRRGSTPGVS
jgi:hypothetical protein